MGHRKLTVAKERADAEMDRRIEALAERRRAEGRARPKSEVRVKRIPPRSLRRG